MAGTDWNVERAREHAGSGGSGQSRQQRRRAKRQPMMPYITAYNSPAAAAFPDVFAPPPQPTMTNYSQPYVTPTLKNAADKAKKRQGMM